MSLKQRMDRLEERLNPNPENMVVVIERHFSPIKDAKAVVPGGYYISRWATALFIGGAEDQWRSELKRLRRDPQYQQDPWANLPKPALESDDATEGPTV